MQDGTNHSWLFSSPYIKSSVLWHQKIHQVAYVNPIEANTSTHLRSQYHSFDTRGLEKYGANRLVTIDNCLGLILEL